jgi:hypothetical protein
MTRRYLLIILLLLALGFVWLSSPQPGKAQDQFGSNWSASYYPSPDFSGTPVTRTEAAINFNWGAGSPDPAIPADNFSARFTGTQTFNGGTFTFTLTRDDGARVFLDNALIMNHTEGGVQTFQTTVTVAAGARNIVVEFIEATGNAQVSLSWRQVGASVGSGTPGAGGGTLACGGTASGTIPVGGSNLYTFSGTSGDVVSIAVNQGTPTTDPTVALFDPTNTQIAYNDDIVFAVNLNSLISNVTLPSTGIYTIIVAGYAGSGGPYTMTLTCQGVTAITVEVVNVRGLSLRTGPYLGATFIRAIRPGNQYTAIARNNDEGIYTWYQIRVPLETQPAASLTAIPGATPVAQQFVTGWSSGRYLAVTGDPNGLPLVSTIFDQIDAAPETGVLGITRAPMNFRRRPSTRTTIMAEIPWGGVVTVIGRTVQGGENFWLHVRWDNGVGWIFAPYITIDGDIDTVPIR